MARPRESLDPAQPSIRVSARTRALIEVLAARLGCTLTEALARAVEVGHLELTAPVSIGDDAIVRGVRCWERRIGLPDPAAHYLERVNENERT